jgi:hypothetical protein
VEYRLPRIVWAVKSRTSRWAGHVTRIEKTGKVLQTFGGAIILKNVIPKSEIKWKGNIKMDLRQVGCDDGSRMELVQGSDHWSD